LTASERLIRNAEAYAARFDAGDLPLPPALGVAVVACMDARVNVYRIFGLRDGDAHLIRNAGGVITQDVLRSLSISQRLLGTTEIILVHHTDCGMQTFSDDEFRHALQEETGIRPEWAVHTFSDVHADVRQCMRRIEVDPFIPHRDKVRGFVYDVHTGHLDEVTT